MSTDAATLARAHLPKGPRDIPRHVSPGLWTLAWRRLRADRVGMVSLGIVIAFIAMMILSGTGLVAADWSREVGVNFAPPTFAGPDTSTMGPGAASTGAAEGPTEATTFKPSVVDPIGDVLTQLKGEKPGDAGAAPSAPSGAGSGAVVDPLADVMKDIQASKGSVEAVPAEVRAATLPFGGDKWGRDVLKKTIKGSETSIFVGLAAAAVATLIGTVLGAVAGYYGHWVDDALNWFYNVFSSIPYLLLTSRSRRCCSRRA